ncbi:MAG: hypothetical protein CME26_14975 [Gemmatimonadetes bacterium]|nr:hypothetical protein [Gemmatimonadota bacterium]
MPDHVQLTGKAGDAILWNGRIWHRAMDNTGTKVRRMLLYNYRHFGMERTAVYDPDDTFKEQLHRWVRSLRGDGGQPGNGGDRVGLRARPRGSGRGSVRRPGTAPAHEPDRCGVPRRKRDVDGVRLRHDGPVGWEAGSVCGLG